jgi:phosphate/phosphite/phosphonate ABC transporter binding protein
MRKTLPVILLILASQIQSMAQKKAYVFATYTYSTNTRLKNLEPLAGYLSEKTGHQITAKSYPTVQALIAAIEKDSVDFAMMNTSGYLVLQRKNPGRAIPIRTLDMGNTESTNYGGCLIAKKDAGFRSLQDLVKVKNKLSLALVNRSSTSGNLVPRLLLNSAGIANADSTFSVSYSGTHKAVIDDVLSGKAMIGGCGCSEVDSARKNLNFDERAFVIALFDDIPLGPVVYNKNVPRPVVAKVNHHLSGVHEERFDVFAAFRDGWTEFRKAVKFKKAKDRDYDRFRKMFGKNEALWEMIE